ncbi:hypothetical protein HMI49_15220 [Corallococcus exercitus]|uniref:DGQHR domain-containing protein n=1 Tax=Corallococcus exercitus TaxID=2316736 RepID=A0A7Y4NRB0_9BACT|nr:hypothetical protein [Corallococcus exercitus]NOK34550.1 hypothetical protein [Corallococcus exercitus]
MRATVPSLRELGCSFHVQRREMIEILSIDLDARLGAHCITARCTYEEFLRITHGAEENLDIQRKIIRGRTAYATLRADLKRGCVLPPLVLAVQDVRLRLPDSASRIDTPDIIDKTEEKLAGLDPSQVYIIDGLQRTNTIRQTAQELQGAERAEFLRRRVRLELWVNISFNAISYRMLLLNAGQHPMPIKHQVEILSMKLRAELSSIPGITIVTSLEAKRRVHSGQFHLSKISQAFQAWLQGQPNVDLRNSVMEQLVAESAIETLGSSLGTKPAGAPKDSFKSLMEWFVAIDRRLPAESMDFLGNETVLQGIAAAVGAAERNPSLADRMHRGLEKLRGAVESSPGTDPLAIQSFEEIRKGIDTAKRNVGQATRDMVFRAFQEYFVMDGNKTMQECWRFAGGT